MPETSLVITTVLTELVLNGGSTRNLQGETTSTGYAVGGQAEPLIFDAVDLIAGSGTDIDKIHTLIGEWIERTPILTVDGTYIGAWLDTMSGKVWLDATRVWPNCTEAKRDARSRKELAIYDLAKGEEIRIETESDRKAAYLSGTVGIVSDETACALPAF